MRTLITRLSIGLAALALATQATAAPACTGQDLRPRLAKEAPATAQAIDAERDAMPFARGRLFQISKAGLAPSYLFGTMHVSDPRAMALPAGLEAALPTARVVALELADAEGVKKGAGMDAVSPAVLAQLLARPVERIDKVLPPQDVEVIEKALEARGQPKTIARTFKPSFLTVVLAMPACVTLREAQSDDFVDAQVARKARQAGVEIAGLETLTEQLDIIAKLPPEAQAQLGPALVRTLPHADDVYETMVNRYVEGETGWLLAWMRASQGIPGVDTSMPRAFYATLLDDRNRRMRDRALPLLSQGNAVIAVGAAHIPGPTGLAQLLVESGYTVQPVE